MYEGEMVEKELEAYGTSIVILVSCHYPHPAGVTMGDRAPQLLQPWQYTGPLQLVRGEGANGKFVLEFLLPAQLIGVVSLPVICPTTPVP